MERNVEDEHSLLLPPAMTAPRKIGDLAMRPIMAVLGGFQSDSMQETHVWHPYLVDSSLLDMSQTAEVSPEDTAAPRKGFFFHVPAVSGMGWKRYSVVHAAVQPFHIGWTTSNRETGEHISTAVHRLTIQDEGVRMLNGPRNERTRFFAVSEQGFQVPVEISAQGVLGTGEHTDIRLL